MAADVLAPCIAKSPATSVLYWYNMLDEQILVFHEGFQQPVPSQPWEMMENANVF